MSLLKLILRLNISMACLAAVTTACAQSIDRLSEPLQWPTTSWTTSSPEAQGMSSSDLADALEFARNNNINIHSLTIVRNGVMVLDAYFHPYTRDMRHDVASVTKSIISLLAGAATADGYLDGTAQPVAAILPSASTPTLDQRVEQIRIGDLLAMQSGFDCGFRRGEPELTDMRRTQDWIAFTMRLPMAAVPGTRYGYCSPNFHLLSAAITTTTDLSAADYARARLFAPLGIDDVHWPTDTAGFSHGWGDLQLRPGDMAKIGLMMLHDGQWEGQQIIPESWIEDSLTSRASVSESEEYGLGWWLSLEVASLFEANGRGGQRISIVPDENLVVVMTGGGFEPGDIGNFVLQSLRADTSLPEDPNGTARLAETLGAITLPAKPNPFTRPETAVRVSSTVYELAANRSGIGTFAIEFSDSAQAILRLGLITGEEIVQPLGLDGVYRLTQDIDGAFTAGRAEWLPDGRLHVELNMLSRINRIDFEVEFIDESVHILASEPTELGSIVIDGVAKQQEQRK